MVNWSNIELNIYRSVITILNFLTVSENEMNEKMYSPLQTVFLIIKYGDEYLLKRDFVGGHWELPATGMNLHETPRECIIRNYGETFGLNNDDLKLVSICKVIFEKTEWRPNPQPEYLALFAAILDNKDDTLTNVDKQLFHWYVPGEDINPYCGLCRELIEYHNSL